MMASYIGHDLSARQYLNVEFLLELATLLHWISTEFVTKKGRRVHVQCTPWTPLRLLELRVAQKLCAMV